MEIEEANKIIDRFMGLILSHMVNKHGGSALNYADSLDVLVPVWEKLDLEFDLEIEIVKTYDGKWSFEIRFSNGGIIEVDEWSKSLQEAACIATAMAIEALNGE